jgi:N-acetylmuramoyl-L-alanine amidase
MPAVVLEAGYITNPEEEQLLSDPHFQQQLAAAIAEGLRRFAREPAGV